MPQDGPHIGFVIQQMENGHRPTDEDVRRQFGWSLDALLELTGLEHRAFTALEDADKIYQISAWNSVDEHYQKVHNTTMFGDLLEKFGDILYMAASYHTTISYAAVPRDVRLFTMMRCRVPDSRKTTFAAAARAWLAFMLETHACKGCAGWRMDEAGPDTYKSDDMGRYRPDLVDRFEDEADEAEEWNVLLPWTSAEKWKAELDVKALSPILENVATLEVRRLKLLETKDV